MDVKVALNKKQIDQLHSLFAENVITEDLVEVYTSSESGIGVNVYARYIDQDLRIHELDITDYENW